MILSGLRRVSFDAQCLPDSDNAPFKPVKELHRRTPAGDRHAIN